MKNLGALELIGDLLEAVADVPLWILLPAIIAVCLYLWATKTSAQSAPREPDAN